MSIRDFAGSFPETEEQADRRRTVEAKLDEFTGKLKELQAKEEQRRVNEIVASVLLRIRERAQKIETHFRDHAGTKQPHTAKGAIKDFEKIVDDEIAKLAPALGAPLKIEDLTSDESSTVCNIYATDRGYHGTNAELPIMKRLIETGHVRREGDLYRLTPKGLESVYRACELQSAR